MKRILLASVFSLALAGVASATAGFGCSAADQNVVALEIEGLTGRDGAFLAGFSASLEIEPGNKIEFNRADVKTFNWGNNIAIHFAKSTPKGLVDVRVYAKPLADPIDLEGNYVLRIGRRTKSGKIKCSGG
jgi:hypothetical protein